MKHRSKAALADRLLWGQTAALARAITLVERGTPESIDLLRALHPHFGHALSIGVTGPPGVGKSTLANGLIHALRNAGHRVGVIAVDPSSPLSGGAILGDRVRMGEHDLDADVFIRSLASRGEQGGLSAAAGRVIDLMDAAGYGRVILETVGAGQSEVDVAELADARVVVCAPGLGDEVQAVKAGILEIADVLVVNKADLPLADATVRQLAAAVHLRSGAGADVPILKTNATGQEGVSALLKVIERCLSHLPRRPEDRARRRFRRLIAKTAATEAEHRVMNAERERLDPICDAVQRGELTLEQAAQACLDPDLP